MLTVQEEGRTRRSVFVLEEVYHVFLDLSTSSVTRKKTTMSVESFFFPLKAFPPKKAFPAHSNVCFGKTILLGGSKYENRKKVTATD